MYSSPDNKNINNKNNININKKVGNENTYATWSKEKNTWGKDNINNKQYPPPPSSPPPPLHLHSPKKPPLHSPKKPPLPPPPRPPPLINRKTKPVYTNNPFVKDDLEL